MTLKDEAQIVHAMLNYHAQKGQLAFKWQDSLMLQACDARARKLYTSARIYEWKFGKGE